jgi:CheY-like chemotaxis protein
MEYIFLGNDTIWIVDDSKFIAQAYFNALASLGYRVLIAGDGKAGLFAAITRSQRLILLSMFMPDIDVPEALRTLKQTRSTKDIPVLVISSLSKEYGKKLMQDRAAGYFEKCFITPENLGDAVSGILSRTIGS